MVRFWTTFMLVGFAEARYYRLLFVCVIRWRRWRRRRFTASRRGSSLWAKQRKETSTQECTPIFPAGLAVFEGAEIDAAPLSTSVALADNPQRIGG